MSVRDALALVERFQLVELLEGAVLVAGLAPRDALGTGDMAAALAGLGQTGRGSILPRTRRGCARPPCRGSAPSAPASPPAGRRAGCCPVRSPGSWRRRGWALGGQLAAFGQPFLAATVHQPHVLVTVQLQLPKSPGGEPVVVVAIEHHRGVVADAGPAISCSKSALGMTSRRTVSQSWVVQFQAIAPGRGPARRHWCRRRPRPAGHSHPCRVLPPSPCRPASRDVRSLSWFPPVRPQAPALARSGPVNTTGHRCRARRGACQLTCRSCAHSLASVAGAHNGREENRGHGVTDPDPHRPRPAGPGRRAFRADRRCWGQLAGKPDGAPGWPVRGNPPGRSSGGRGRELVRTLTGLAGQGLQVTAEPGLGEAPTAARPMLTLELVGADHPGIVHDIAHALASRESTSRSSRPTSPPAHSPARLCSEPLPACAPRPASTSPPCASPGGAGQRADGRYRAGCHRQRVSAWLGPGSTGAISGPGRAACRGRSPASRWPAGSARTDIGPAGPCCG